MVTGMPTFSRFSRLSLILGPALAESSPTILTSPTATDFKKLLCRETERLSDEAKTHNVYYDWVFGRVSGTDYRPSQRHYNH